MLSFNPTVLREIPEPFQKVIALQQFAGTSKGYEDLRSYEMWYTQQMVERLMHAEPKSTTSPLRVVFQSIDNGQSDSFGFQLKQLNMVRTGLNRPLLFISKEPGIAQNHFIFGILENNNLLVINPVGETKHTDFYKSLSQIQRELKINLYLSETPIQHDTDGSLVSCGPICTELANYFFKSNLKVLFEELAKKGVEKKNPQLNYKSVDIALYLPQTLQNILNEREPRNYQTKLQELRLRQLNLLLHFCFILQNEKDINHYFEEECINASEQQLLNLLNLNQIGLLDLLSHPLFTGLSTNEHSPLVQKILQARDQQKLGEDPPSPEADNQNAHKNDLKWLFYSMLFALIAIPFAHFFVWPYMASILSVAAFHFLTASTTPWILAGLSLALFVPLIISTALYEHSAKNQPQVEPVKTTSDDALILGGPAPLRFSTPYQSQTTTPGQEKRDKTEFTLRP